MTPYYLRPITALYLFICGTWSLSAIADQQNDELNKFFSLSLEELAKVEITTATGNSKPLDKAPATASLITAAQIEAMGARTLNDVLETVPGLHVSLSSLSRLDSILSIRGIHTGFNPHVLVLKNGVPINFNAQGGRPVSFRFPVTSIEQIEVIRGPGSAIYGADAFSGVINIITKDSANIVASKVGGRLGSFDSQDFWVQTSGAVKNWNVGFSMTYMTSDGDDDRILESDVQSQLDGIFGTDASLAPGLLATNYEILDTHLSLNNENWKINLWSWITENSGVGAGAALALDDQGGDDNTMYFADVTYELENWADNWNLSARAAHTYYKNLASFNIFPAGTIVPIGEDGNVSFLSSNLVAFPEGLKGNPGGVAEDSYLDLVSIYSGVDSHRIRLSVGGKYQSLETSESKNFGPGVIDGQQPVVDGTLTNVSDTPFVYLADSSRSVKYISLQDEWQLANNWELTAGIRYDDYSDFGDTTNPRIALVWSTSEFLTTKLLFGSAFRAPAFTEQLLRNNPVSLGNPDLNPEEIDTLELAFNLRPTKNLLLNLSMFRYSATDMIEYLPDTGATSSTAQNARDQDGQGFEVELAWKPRPKLRFDANYSWHDAEDTDTNYKVAETARSQLTLMSQWEFTTNWFFTAQANWVGNRERAPTDPREPVDDYTIVDLKLRKKQLVNNVDFSIAVKNATDEDAREPSNGQIPEDYPLESRSVSAELIYNF